MTDQQILTEIRNDLVEIKKSINEIHILDVKQNYELETHIRRSDFLEELVKELRAHIATVEEKLTKRLDSDQTFRRWFLGVATLVGTVSSALVAFFMKIL